MLGGASFGYGRFVDPVNRIRQIRRDLDWANRRRRKKRRPLPGHEAPCGPKLVRGRGYVRRRPRSVDLGALVFVLFAAALAILAVKYVVLPALT